MTRTWYGKGGRHDRVIDTHSTDKRDAAALRRFRNGSGIKVVDADHPVQTAVGWRD